MKKSFFLSLLLLLPLVSCGRNNNTPSSISSGDQQSNVVSSNNNSFSSSSEDKTSGASSSQGTTSNPQDDFIIKTSDNGVSIDKGLYVLARANPNEVYDSFVDDFRLKISIPSNIWKTKDIKKVVTIQDKTIVKDDAFTFDNSQDSEGYVEQITTIINREKLLKAGKTKIKISLKANSSNNAEFNANLCFEFDIRDYGQIIIDTFENITLTFDKERLKEKMKAYTNVDEIFFEARDYDRVYGSSAGGLIRNYYDPKTFDGNYTTTFNFAKGHVYVTAVYFYYYDDAGQYQVEWFKFKEDLTNPTKYKVSDQIGSASSHIEVFADNLTINLILE